MKYIITTITGFLIVSMMLLLSGCGSNSAGPTPSPPGDGTGTAIKVPDFYKKYSGTLIKKDQIWSHDTTITGPHFILPGVTLTVEKGVTVTFKYTGSSSSQIGVLVALSGDSKHFNKPRLSARIVAKGTANQPIVFTSSRKKPSSWGGIILVGRAPNNRPGGTGEAEGFTNPVSYGGDEPHDDSGTLQYVRIEYTGFAIAPGSELQSLSLYAVGDGTTLNHINAYISSDDGVEIFGGTVNIKYYVVVGADDDSFDYDEGWQGNGQFWLAVQYPGGGSGLENDGCATPVAGCEKRGMGPTSPTVTNVTLYGSGQPSKQTHYGIHGRQNLQGNYLNFIIDHVFASPFYLDGETPKHKADPTAIKNYGASLKMEKFIIYDNKPFQDNSEAGIVNESDSVRYSSTYTQENPMFKDVNPNNLGRHHDFSLKSGSSALHGAAPLPDNGFFTQVDYIGAFGTIDWTKKGSWVRFK